MHIQPGSVQHRLIGAAASHRFKSTATVRQALQSSSHLVVRHRDEQQWRGRKMRNVRYDYEEFNLNHCSVSLLIIINNNNNMSDDQRAHRSSDYKATATFIGRERAYHPSRVRWLHREILVPFPSHPAPTRVSPIRLPTLMFDRDSFPIEPTTMTATMKAQKSFGLIR